MSTLKSKQLTVALMATYIVSQLMLKWALALFFLRFIIKPWQRRTMFGITAFFTILAFITLFLEVFNCGTPTVEHLLYGKCFDFNKVLSPVGYLFATLLAVVDWVNVLFAILATRAAQLSSRRKRSVIGIILFGCTGSAVSVARIPYTTATDNNHQLDYFSHMAVLGLLSVAESGIGVIALSLVALRPLFRRARGVNVSTMGAGTAYGHERSGFSLGYGSGRGHGQSQQLSTLNNSRIETEQGAGWTEMPRKPEKTYKLEERAVTFVDEYNTVEKGMHVRTGAVSREEGQTPQNVVRHGGLERPGWV